jgi:ribosomal protein L22
MSETRAVLRGVRLSVDKGRLVADLIRGKKVDQALNILTSRRKKLLDRQEGSGVGYRQRRTQRWR